MTIQTQRIPLETKKQFEIIDITAQVAEVVTQSGVQKGVVTVFNPHTTASVRLNHNEPLLQQDLLKMVYRLVPADINYAHDVFEMRENVAFNERTNGHAHTKAFLFGSSESIPVEGAKLMLGDRQSIFFIEFDGGRPRDYIVSVMGE